jgi:hypothetical protein
MAVKPEKVHGPPAGNFFKRRVEKTYHFWTKTYLIWKAHQQLGNLVSSGFSTEETGKN